MAEPDAREADADVRLSDEESLFARDPLGRLIRVDRPTEADLAKRVGLRIDGLPVDVPKAVPATDAQGNVLYHPDGSTVVRATTIHDAGRLVRPPAGGGVRIPVLCHQDHVAPVAVCRACVVQIVAPDPRDPAKKREQRKLLPACQHRAEDGMEVHTLWSPDEKYRKVVRSSVQVVYELLAGDHLHPARDAALGHRDRKYRNELADLGETLRANWGAFPGDAGGPREAADRDRLAGAGPARFAAKPARDDLLVGWDPGRPDRAAPPFVVDHNSCILCDRCARGCGEVKPFRVIGRSGKGPGTRIAFDLRDLPMAESSCRACGECMTACPTGAISFQYPVRAAAPGRPDRGRGGDVVGADELADHPLFCRLPRAFLEWNRGAVRRRAAAAGEVLGAEGEYGTTAFLVEDGYVAICRKGAAPPAKLAHADDPGVAAGLRGLGTRHGTPIGVQGPDPADPVGEMSPMSHARRNAALVMATPGRVLEVDRNVLFVMLRDPVNRDALDGRYARRALAEFLPRLAAGPGLFGALAADELGRLVRHVGPAAQVVRADPGFVICREGSPADDFYLIRLGFVGVATAAKGGWVRPPLRQGDCFGEVAVLSGRPAPAGEPDWPPGMVRGVRNATCTALDHAELVRVPGDVFGAFLGDPGNAAAGRKLRARAAQLYGGARR